ncbi:hypothetical protein K9M79_07235 [Candidatus Woesearchaeota archaeon]|nr:hypothetical protein [Candidatus Woesearchaeota archaeon]
MTNVHILRGSCPVCSGDLKGNNEIHYYCCGCKMIFSENNIFNPLPSPGDDEYIDHLQS